MRRKTATAANDADEFTELSDLNDGEKIVIQDTRTIERQPAPAAQPRTVAIEPDDDDETADDDFSDDSIFTLIASKGPALENDFCTLHIRRDPDGSGDKFLTPCGSRLSLPSMRNIPLSMEKSEIEDRIRNEHGGGHYLLTIHFRGKFVQSFQLHLADSPQAIAAARAASQPQPAPIIQPAAPQSNPMESFLQSLEQTNRLKQLMFGDEIKELEELRRRDRERQTATPPPAEAPKPEKIQLLEFAVNSTNDKLIEKAIVSVFGDETADKSSGVMDVLKFALENKTEIVQLGQAVLSSFIAPAPAATPTRASVERLLGKQPAQTIDVTPAPAAAIQPAAAPPSTFKRQGKTDTDK